MERDREFYPTGRGIRVANARSQEWNSLSGDQKDALSYLVENMGKEGPISVLAIGMDLKNPDVLKVLSELERKGMAQEVG